MKEAEDSYFSFIFSPFRKRKNKNNNQNPKHSVSSYKVASANDYGNQGDGDFEADVFTSDMVENTAERHAYKKECAEEDIDCKAEDFIREKRKKLLFSKTISSFFARK